MVLAAFSKSEIRYYISGTLAPQRKTTQIRSVYFYEYQCQSEQRDVDHRLVREATTGGYAH